MPSQAVLERVLSREKLARKEAEQLLEAKSRELYQANQALLSLTQDLQQQNVRFEAILNSAADGILTINGDGEIISFNRASKRIFGLQDEGDYKIDALLHESATIDLMALRNQDTIALGFENPLEGIRADNGDPFLIELSVSAVKTADDFLYVAIVRDVSRRRLLERQLSLAQKMESVGQLAAGVAHEINTPIQYIGENTLFLGNAFEQIEKLLEQVGGLIDADSPDSSSEHQSMYSELTTTMQMPLLRQQIQAAIEQTSAGVQRVATIVGAMKEFSHPGTEEKSPVDINRAIEITLTVARNEWRYHADVELDLEDSIPWVPGLPSEINQALLNLVINAAHAVADTQGEHGKIRISTRGNDRFVTIVIEDNGIGIPQEVQTRVFEPFFTTKAIGRGTGQGLSIVYSVIVEKHSGQIDIRSEPGAGTRVILRLPTS